MTENFGTTTDSRLYSHQFSEEKISPEGMSGDPLYFTYQASEKNLGSALLHIILCRTWLSPIVFPFFFDK